MKILPKPNSVKNLPRLAALVASALLSSVPTYGLMRVAGGELTLRTSAEVSYGDRINGFRSSPSDVYYVFTTGLGYEGNTSGRTRINATIDVPLVRFSDESQNNSDDLSIGLDLSRIDDPRFKVSYNFKVSYDDSTKADYLVNNRIDEKSFAASFRAKYNLSLKTHLRSGISYDDRDTSLSSNESIAYSAGLGLNNFLFGRVGGYIDYQIRDRKRTGGLVQENVDDTDGNIVFGFTGQILPERLFPKLEADLSFGFQSTDSFDGGKRDTTTINGRLTYPASPKTSVSFVANRDLTITADDRNVLQTSFTLSATHTLRQNLSWTSSISTSNNDFVDFDREDDTFNIQTQLAYRFVSPLTLSGSIFYRSNDSTQSASDFDSTTFSIRASYVF